MMAPGKIYMISFFSLQSPHTHTHSCCCFFPVARRSLCCCYKTAHLVSFHPIHSYITHTRQTYRMRYIAAQKFMMNINSLHRRNCVFFYRSQFQKFIRHQWHTACECVLHAKRSNVNDGTQKEKQTKKHLFQIYVRNKKAKLYRFLTFVWSSFVNDSVSRIHTHTRKLSQITYTLHGITFFYPVGMTVNYSQKRRNAMHHQTINNASKFEARKPFGVCEWYFTWWPNKWLFSKLIHYDLMFGPLTAQQTSSICFD